jgi:hypothetical protein
MAPSPYGYQMIEDIRPALRRDDEDDTDYGLPSETPAQGKVDDGDKANDVGQPSPG